MTEDPETKEQTSANLTASSPSSPMRTITGMATHNLADEQRYRSESEPIMTARACSTNSLNSSLASDRDSVISTSSTSSEANICHPYLLKDGTATNKSKCT